MKIPLIFAGSAIAFACSAAIASAHPLDVAYLDFGASTSSKLTLTVALHPYQAFELIRGDSVARFDLKRLQQNGELVSAYADDHVDITQDGQACIWSPGSASTPPTELEAVGDGVTISGDLSCPGSGTSLTVGSTLFLDGFPGQTSILRLDLPAGYADRLTLDHAHLRGTLNVAELFVTPASPQPPTAPDAGRRPDAQFTAIAQKLLDPGLGLWGFLALLASAVLIGALHALGPGHGKSLLAATLVGERSTFRNLFALGTVMTVTHVSDVFLMTLVASFISNILPPTTLLSFLEFLSAVGLVVLGFWGFIRAVRRYRQMSRNPETAETEEAHQRAHELGLPHTHGAIEAPPSDHVGQHDASFRKALWLGFVGSLAPCPTAWAIFMATLSVGRSGTGALLLIAFTFGLYATVMAIGALVLRSKQFAMRRTSPRFTYALPVISSCIIMGLGIAFLVTQRAV